ncbi:MAG: phage terminase large subunit family protein, partial [Deltaproteobacteria bacterium]
PVTAGAGEKSEGSLRNYIRQRVRAYKNFFKIWWSSTPTVPSGHITQYMTTEAQVIFDYRVRCPDCGAEQLMDFKGIMKSFPKELTDPQEMEKKKCAGYVCKHCGSIWDERKRDHAVIAAMYTGWRARGDGRRLKQYLDEENPEKICFHSPSWISPLVPFWEIAAQWLKGRRNKKEMRILYTQYFAAAFSDYGEIRKESAILRLRDDRPRGIVPGGGRVACLLGSADTQDDCFYYEIRAYGYGMSQESWCVREGVVLTFEDLAKVLFHTRYSDVDGNQYIVQQSIIDAMGHRTKEVYEFCVMNRGRIWPLKGEQTMTAPHAWSKIEVYPGTNTKIPGGVMLLRLHTNYYKDDLSNRLGINPTDPGAWHLHRDYTEEWASHMCAEFVNDKGFWECPANKPNHGFDVAVYNHALADVCQVKFLEKPVEKPAVQASRVRSKGIEA